MKSIILLLALLIPVTSIAQDKKYQLYKCVKAGSRNYVNNKWSAWDNIETNLTFRLCFDEDILEFNNENNTVFHIIEELEKRSGVDSDGDKYTVARFRGYDNDGVACHLVIMNWHALSNMNFYLEYSNIEFKFITHLIQ